MQILGKIQYDYFTVSVYLQPSVATVFTINTVIGSCLSCMFKYEDMVKNGTVLLMYNDVDHAQSISSLCDRQRNK